MSYVAFPPDAPDVYGQVLSAYDVRQALLETIQTWSPQYITEIASVKAVTMAPFGLWEAIPENRALPPDLTAACWTTCTTTDPKRPPQRQGDGTYAAVWVADANIVLFGTDWQTTVDLIANYSAAVRALVLQHGSLGGFAVTTKWLGEASKELEHQRTRTVQLAVISFAVTVQGAVNTLVGPTTPTPPTPPGTSGGPTVATANVTVKDFALDDAGFPNT
jgi:hypothetical protein